MMYKRIKTLLAPWCEVTEKWDRDVGGLSLDSRATKPGDLFFALPGLQFDGRKFINDAIEKGACAVLSEPPEGEVAAGHVVDQSGVPIFYISNLSQSMGQIASAFYDHPSRDMTLIGITGTNGKTTCAQLIAQLFESAGRRCGVMGTLGVGYVYQLAPSARTTPDVIAVQSALARFKAEGAEAVVMEVSSHALVQHRVEGVEFDVAIFTNLSHDHLDYHGDMETYWAAKKLLFQWPSVHTIISNVDDPRGIELLESYREKEGVTVYGYGLETTETAVNPQANVRVSGLSCERAGMRGHFVSPWGEAELAVSLLGEFNMRNVLCALTAVCALGVPLENALEGSARLKPVQGRMQAFGGRSRPLVVVDYAHTPDALEKTLRALRPHTQGKLWCVFGCGGDRDKAKRPLMGEVAERYSDELMITNDNPRHEVPQAVIDDIIAGLHCPWGVEVESDRAAAIAHVMHLAEPGDVVLIAGKGHEDYQEIGDKKFPFSDVEQVMVNL